MVFRLPPQGPASAYRTWGIARPLSTHWRPATCDEVGCPQWQRGWSTTVLVGSDEEALLRQAASGRVDGHARRFTRVQDGAGMARYVFGAEQPCFKASTHRVPLERPELYAVRSGDWRADLGGRHTYDRADQWVEDMRDNQDRIIAAQEWGAG